MTKAIIEIDTYNEGRSTRINYEPGTINQHVVISVLEDLALRIREQTRNNECSTSVKRQG